MKGIKQVLMGFIVWYNHRHECNVDIMDSVRFIRQLKPDELRNSETDKEYCADNYDYSNCLIHNSNRFGCLSCTGDKQYEVKKLNKPAVVVRSEQLICPKCENPYPHLHADGSYSCEDCGHNWAN